MPRINVLGGLYVSDEGRPLSGAAAQPRRLALLALLAVAADRGVTRDALLAYLWPDADEERGRRALAQALYALRRDLGNDEAFLGMKDLRLNPDVVQTDLHEFQDSLATGSLERAAELYRGPFLEGFHLPGAETFERWVEDERLALGHQYGELLDRLADRCRERNEPRAAAGWLRRLAAQDPLNARIATRLMECLAAQGDVAGALQHARVYETLVRQELDLPPDREVIQLAERLRQSASRSSEGAPTVPPPEPAAPAPLPPDPPAPAPRSVTETATGEVPDEPAVAEEVRHTSGWAALVVPPEFRLRPRRGRFGWRVGVPLLLAGVGLLLLGIWSMPRGTRVTPAEPLEPGRVVAVGRIAHYTAQGLGSLGQPLADMLATNLARAAGMRVISSARMYEVLGQLAPASDTTAGMVVAAARRAGATELVDGALYEVAPSQYRLDLRRVDLASGAVLHAYTVQAPDLFTLADSGTGRLVGDLGGRAPAGSLADVTTRSVAAYGHYEAGLRAYFQGHRSTAERSFAAALAEDSAFAMAQFYYSLSASGNRAEVFTRLRRAVELAERASDRERLIIDATWAFSNSSPAIRAYAETLMVRYPAELEGYLLAGQGATLAADYAAARGPLHEVIARDSLGLKGQAVRCLACEALNFLVGSYLEADSLPGALRISRLWTRLQPASARAWRVHAMILGQAGRIDSGRAALRTADSLDPGTANAWTYALALHLWNNEFEQAEELARVVAQTGPPAERTEARWSLALVYRQEGRLNEALAAARSYRAEAGDVQARGAAPNSALLEAQVLFEQGRNREAAALFDSIGRGRIPFEDSSASARNRIWTATHAATALAAAGDTSRLPALAEELQQLGRLSGLGRDRRLHHYVRGLLAKSRGDWEAAAGDFRQAIVSPNMGYSRINLELAGVLLRLGRPAEAIGPLQSALRGVFEGSSLYTTHTELHERLAQAFETAGRPDSAAAHYRVVARAWQRADPQFTPRQLEAAGRAMRLLSEPAGNR